MSSFPSISPGHVVKWFLRITAGILLMVLLVIFVIIGGLQTDWGANQVRNLVVSQINQSLDGTVEIGQLGGSFITSLEVSEIQLYQDGEPMASVDRASVDYSLRALINQTLHVESATISNPYVILRQDSDSTWNFARLVPADTAADTTAGAWNVRVDALEVTNGNVEAHFYPPEQDSVLESRDLNLRARNLYFGTEPWRGQLEQFTTEVRAFDEAATYQMEAAGHVNASEYVLDSLSVVSSTTNLFAELKYSRPEKTRAERPVSGRLRADPLRFEDLHPFFPALPRSDSLNAIVELDGTTQQMQLDAEARISEDARFAAEATFTPPSKRPLSYEATVSLENLSLARLTGDPQGLTDMNGQVTVDLQGPSFEELSGTADIRLSEITWSNQSMGPVQVSSQWQEGQTTFQAEAQFVAGSITLDGTAAPFADIPTYGLNSYFQDVNLSHLPGSYGSGRLTGQLELSGAGTDLDNLSTRAELHLRSSTYESIYIQKAHLTTEMRDRIVELSSDVDLRGGNFSTQARIRPFRDPISYDISAGRFNNVNLETLLHDTTMTTDLNGTLSVSGEGTSPDSLNVDGELELDRSTYEGYVLEDGALVADVEPAGLRLEGALNSPGGALDFNGRANPFADVPSADQFTANFRGVDIGYILQDTSYASSLHGQLNISAAGTELSTAVVNATITLDSSQVNHQAVRSASAAVTLDDGLATVETLVDLPDGQLDLEGEAQPFEDNPTYAVDPLQFTNIHVGQWLGQTDLTTTLTGSIELGGTGFDPETAVIDANADLESFQINAFTANQARIDASWTKGTFATDLGVDYSNGGITANVTGRLLNEPLQLNGTGRVENLAVTQLAGIDTLDSRLSLTFDVETESARSGQTATVGKIDLTESYLADITVESAFGAFAVFENSVHVDSLGLASNVLDLSGEGRIALPESPQESAFTFNGNVENLAPLTAVVPIDSARGVGSLSGEVTGTPDSMRFALETELTGLTYNGYSAAYLESQSEGVYSGELTIDVDATVGALALETTVIDRLEVDARYAEEALTFANDIIIDRDREGRLVGRLEQIENESVLTVDSLAMRVGDQQWELLQPATIRYGERYVVRDLTLDEGTQKIAVDGVIDPDGTHDMNLVFETVQLDPLTDLVGYDGVGGELDGSATLTGPATSPSLKGDLAFRDFTSRERAVGDLLISLDYDDFQMEIDVHLDHRTGRELTVAGTIPVNLSTADPPSQQTLDLTARADSITIGWVDPFLDPTVARDIAGYLTVEMELTGTFEAPALKGFVRLSEGNVELPSLGTDYTAMNLAVQLEDDVASIEQASMRSGDGRLLVDGTVDLPALNLGEFDLSVNADNFRAADTRTYSLAVDSDLRLEGTTEQPVIRGNLTVTEATFFLESGFGGADVEEVTLDQENIRQIQTRFGIYVPEDDTAQYDPYEALVIDTVNVNMNRDVWLRSSGTPEMAIELMGDLTVVKSAREELQAFGTIETVPARSYIEQFGRRFQLTTGVLNFNGPLETPVLDIQAEYRLRGARAQPDQPVLTLQLQGPVDDPSLELGSEQGLTSSEIVSYLILGRPPGQTTGGATSVESLTTTAAIGQLTDLVEGLAMSELGLDVIEIEHDAQRGATLTAGAYVTQQLFASVSWPISLSNERATDWTNQQVTLEYAISNWLILQFERESTVNSVDLIWEYAY